MGEVATGEIEHVVQRPGDSVERLIADATELPVVFDEAQDGTLIGRGTGIIGRVRIADICTIRDHIRYRGW